MYYYIILEPLSQNNKLDEKNLPGRQELGKYSSWKDNRNQS